MPLKAASAQNRPTSQARNGSCSSSLSRSCRILSAVHAWHRLAAKQQLQASLPTRRHGRLSSQILATDDNREWVLSQASHFCNLGALKMQQEDHYKLQASLIILGSCNTSAEEAFSLSELCGS